MKFVHFVSVILVFITLLATYYYEQSHNENRNFLVFLNAKLKNESELYCFGTYIDEQFILTAAHCLNDTDTVWIKFLGEHTLDVLENVLVVKATEDDIIVHENFKNETIYINDIGLIKLNTTTVKAINSEGKYMNTTKLSDNQDKDSMKSFKVLGGIFDIISFRDVTKMNCSYDLSTILCTDPDGLHEGDSGAPLMYDEEQIGIVSGYYNQELIYVFLPFYNSWIEKQKNLYSSNSQYSKYIIGAVIICTSIVTVFVLLKYYKSKQSSSNLTTTQCQNNRRFDRQRSFLETVF